MQRHETTQVIEDLFEFLIRSRKGRAGKACNGERASFMKKEGAKGEIVTASRDNLGVQRPAKLEESALE